MCCRTAGASCPRGCRSRCPGALRDVGSGVRFPCSAAGYLLLGGFVALGVCSRNGPVENQRSICRLCWGLQLLLTAQPGPVGTSVLIGIPLSIRFLHGCRWDEGQKVLKGVDAVPVWVGEGGAAELRLVDGGSRCAGRVEVEHEGHRSGPIWLIDIQCRGSEPALSNCTHSGWGENNCVHSMDAGVSCSGFRLVNGSTACEGRVELHVQGTWGSLCASRWHLSDAHVLCGRLGCGFAVSLPRGGSFGRGMGPVWRDSFHCSGTEAHLGQCPVTVLGASPCSHEDAAAVVCSGPAGSGSLRLVGGGSRCTGRVEIFQHGTWGRVLSEQWDVAEARVACRQLRCGEAEMAYNPPKAERGPGPVGLRGGGWAAGPRRHLGSIPAAGSRRVRLANGPGRCAGRVEIYSQGSWGSVCDYGWDLPDAAVVCRQLGCGEAVEAPGSAAFGEGSGHIWLDGVNCSGAEAALWDCPAGPWGRHDCGHKEDAGAVCSEFTALRLESSDGCSGRLQVFYNGTWGSVCSNSMTPKTVSLACEELGCGKEGTLDTQWPRGRVSGPAWLDRVECEERHGSFWLCPSDPWNPRSCDELRDVTHITCRGIYQMPVLKELFRNNTWGILSVHLLLEMSLKQLPECPELLNGTGNRLGEVVPEGQRDQ
ncbi:scavenger receptor cysteine-rich type 1 protein M130-like [Colius striatus]|uniref:scavenger receptor cysteine-rich type 1 protein M130-like n=1 Tax=Colius striatus TaxID=57412 RepID=UPI002B1CF774|nr:scavenger receptor cysteine-rich type 1 protein M130-like [Colius striatus]